MPSFTGECRGGAVESRNRHGVQAAYSPDGKRLAYNQKSQVYWRKYYRGSYQSDIMVMDVVAKKFTQVTDFDGLDSWPKGARRVYLLRQRRDVAV